MFGRTFGPDEFCPSLLGVDFRRLNLERGISYLLVDLDNTVTRRGDSFPSQEVVDHLLGARRSGFLAGCMVISNICLPIKQLRDRVILNAWRLQADGYVHACWPHLKPHPQPFLRAMALLEKAYGSRVDCRNTVVVGDQLFTDIAGGKALGCYTILVRPLGRDAWFTWLHRHQEARVLRRLGLHSTCSKAASHR